MLMIFPDMFIYIIYIYIYNYLYTFVGTLCYFLFVNFDVDDLSPLYCRMTCFNIGKQRIPWIYPSRLSWFPENLQLICF